MIRRCGCGADVLVAVADNGCPLTLDIGPAKVYHDPPGGRLTSWLKVWQDGRYVRCATIDAPPGAVPHDVHRCRDKPWWSAVSWPADGRPAAGHSLLGTGGPPS